MKANRQRQRKNFHLLWLLALLTMSPGCGREEKNAPAARLEARVGQLETNLAKFQGEAAAAAQLNSRITQLEQDLAKLKGQVAVPRLGSIMVMVQMRHTKLWWAGGAGNWELAAYELEELKEDLDDIEKFHPTRGTPPVRLDLFVSLMMKPLVAELQKTIQNKNLSQFIAAYDNLTMDCNQCHQATGVAANLIVRPTSAPFGDQDFLPRKPDGAK